MASASGEPHRFRPLKTEWPELLGMKGEEAAAIIERENPSVNAIIVPPGTSVIRNFDPGRVWVWVDDHCLVKAVPMVG